MALPLTPQYHVRHFELEFKSWRMQSLVQCLSALPLLITLKIKGFCSYCIPTYGWLSASTWDQILQNLKALQRVNIDIAFGIPMRLKVKTSKGFNERVAQYTQTTKRINLAAVEKADPPYIRCVQLTALL